MITKKQKNQIINSKPKYKIGDIVVYVDKMDDSGGVERIVQSEIVYSNGYIDLKDEKDVAYWTYNTKATERADEGDCLEEEEIIYKLN